MIIMDMLLQKGAMVELICNKTNELSHLPNPPIQAQPFLLNLFINPILFPKNMIKIHGNKIVFQSKNI